MDILTKVYHNFEGSGKNNSNIVNKWFYYKFIHI